MVQIKFSKSWIYITKLDKKELSLPYRAKASKDGVYKIPNTPYNFNFCCENNEVEDLLQTRRSWEDHFRKNDNKDLRPLMEKMKVNELATVKKIQEILPPRNITLWDFLFSHQVITVYLSLLNNSYGLFLEMGGGKAQPLTSLILTPKGWVKMGDIKVGDEVINPEGGTSKVTGIFPQGIVKTYEVKTFDGGKCECSGDHLWQSRIAIRKNSSKIRTTDEIKKLIEEYKTRKKDQRRTVLLPVTEAVDFEEAPLPIDPYILGILLGDGAFSKSGITLHIGKGKEEILNYIQNKGITFGTLKKYKTGSGVGVLKSREKFTSLNLWGKRSWEKSIPSIYLNASRTQREELLQGLMDTDGTIGQNGNHIEFCSTSKKLALGVQYLARSLGCVAKVAVQEKPHYRNKNGDKVICKTAYRISIISDNPKSLFKLTRKKDRCKKKYCDSRSLLLSRRITEINYTGEKECQCISLDSKNGLYITNDFIVTHNTIASLQVATVRLDGGHTDSVLIIAPDSIIKPVWAKEIDSVRKRTGNKNLTYEVLDGSKEERIYKLQHSQAKIFLLNYEMVGKLLPFLINKGFNMMILDESTRVKNNQAQVTKAVHNLALRIRYKLILTGTPIPNTEMDIHSQINVLQLGSYFTPLNPNFYAFRTIFFYKPTMRFAPYRLRKDKREKLNQGIYSLAIHYKREECQTLPPLVVQSIPCDMTAEQWKSYRELKENVLTEIKGKKIEATIALTKLLRLAQITAGFSNDIHGNPIRFDKKPKIETVLELVEEIPTKVVVFCRFIETIKILHEALGDKSVTFYGDNTKTEKEEALEKFEKDPNVKVMIAQIASGGLGLNLQFANYVIFCELDYLASNFLQAIARIYRTGQTKKCTVYIVMSKGTIDEHLYEVIQDKKKTAEQILKTVVRQLEETK